MYFIFAVRDERDLFVFVSVSLFSVHVGLIYLWNALQSLSISDMFVYVFYREVFPFYDKCFYFIVKCFHL